MGDIPADWFDGFFEHEWLDLLALGSSSDWTEKTVDFLVEELGLREGTRVLDLACGRGRVSIPLAQRGCRVTGIDLSPNSLDRARRDAEEAGVELELVQRDMRDLDAVDEYDVVLNLYTSFGYFAEQADDERVLAAVARTLRPGGSFLLDTIDPIALAPRFRELEWHDLDGGVTMLERRSWDKLRGRMLSYWTFVRPDGTRSEVAFSHRMYTAPELVRMLAGAGLEVDGAWGGWDGTELGDGRRIVLRAHT